MWPKAGRCAGGIGTALRDAAALAVAKSARAGTQPGAVLIAAPFETMFIARKQSLLTQFLKFGVDDQGTIIPILRRNKGHAAKSNTEYRPPQIPLKSQLASH